MSASFLENKSCGVTTWDLIDKGLVWAESTSNTITIEECYKFCMDEKLKIPDEKDLCCQHTVISAIDPLTETKVCHISTDKMIDLTKFEGDNGYMISFA